MSRAAETAVELRRIAAQVRKQADRLDRMAANMDAGRPMHEGIGQVVVLDAETGDRCSWADVALGSATSLGARATNDAIDMEVP